MKITRIALLAGMSAVGVFAQLPSQKMLTVELAETIAQEAMAKCRADGFKVTVTVVDHANMLKAFLRDDGAAMATIEVGRMKTNSVMAFGRPSGPPPPPPNMPPGTAPPTGGGIALPGTINAAGGMPIKAGDQLIGAVSVSGAPGGDKDVVCANAALAKVADKLR